jgi:hypothetical protein
MRIRFGPVQLPPHFHAGRTVELDDDAAAALYEHVELEPPRLPEKSFGAARRLHGKKSDTHGKDVLRVSLRKQRRGKARRA